MVNHLSRDEIISKLKEADMDTIFSITSSRLNRIFSVTYLISSRHFYFSRYSSVCQCPTSRAYETYELMKLMRVCTLVLFIFIVVPLWLPLL